MRENKNLFKLKELKDYEVSDSDPDIRGWEVYSSDNKKIAKVDELIVDPGVMKVRYLDILLNKDITEVKEGRHLLIPVGAARLDEKENKVFIDYIETVTLLKTPQYDGNVITKDYEKNVRDYLTDPKDKNIRDYSTDIKDKNVTDKDFYDNKLFDEERFYGTRRKRFVKLSEVDSKEILRDKPDIKGQSVFTLDGEKIGTIDDAFFEPSSKKIRYLDILTDGNESDDLGNRHILIPIGLAAKKREENKIILDLTKKTLLGFPVFKGDTITKEFERSIVDRANMNISSEKDFYENTYYDSERFL